MKTAVIKYNAGNTQSVLFALERLGVKAELTDNPEKIMKSDKVIFPGVGEASSTMQYLRERKLDELIIKLKQPVLGICLGMQLMCSYSEEGDTECLGIFPQKVLKFKGDLKIPHMGWNSITKLKTNLFKDLPESKFVYFVHSFYVEKGQQTIADCNYILNFSAALQKDNFYATQFHPEKSGQAGEQILKNFLKI